MTKYINKYYLNGELHKIKFEKAKVYDIDISNLKSESDIGTLGAGYCGNFSMDGTYYFCRTSNYNIRRWTLTTPFDMTSSDDTAIQDFTASSYGEVHQTYINEDGTKLAYCGYYGDMGVRIVTLTTPYDMSTATNEKYLSEGSVVGLWFKPDGTRMYLGYYNYNGIKQYDLSTPWDITTGTYTGQLATGTERGVTLSPDGKILIKTDGSNSPYHTTIQYELSTPRDITTATQYASIYQNHYGMCAIALDGSRLSANGNYVAEFYELTN